MTSHKDAKEKLSKLVLNPVIKDLSTMSSSHLAALQDSDGTTAFVPNKHVDGIVDLDMINLFNTRKHSLRQYFE
jgi:hypothetical protein